MRGEEPLKSYWKRLTPHGLGKGSLPEVGSFKEGNPLPALGASAKGEFHLRASTCTSRSGHLGAPEPHPRPARRPRIRGSAVRTPGWGASRPQEGSLLLRRAEGLSKSTETTASWSCGAAGASAHVVTSQDTHDATQLSADYM